MPAGAGKLENFCFSGVWWLHCLRSRQLQAGVLCPVWCPGNCLGMGTLSERHRSPLFVGWMGGDHSPRRLSREGNVPRLPKLPSRKSRQVFWNSGFVNLDFGDPPTTPVSPRTEESSLRLFTGLRGLPFQCHCFFLEAGTPRARVTSV